MPLAAKSGLAPAVFAAAPPPFPPPANPHLCPSSFPSFLGRAARGRAVPACGAQASLPCRCQPTPLPPQSTGAARTWRSAAATKRFVALALQRLAHPALFTAVGLEQAIGMSARKDTRSVTSHRGRRTHVHQEQASTLGISFLAAARAAQGAPEQASMSEASFC
ncbi:unnamed protein product [Prorocentrum cordatum]|uniref:Uncharacterized protein n=1 Tax=Prorocentrum cordatum TaxID=2364126 RepID=A0ABN9QE93_9DINO|nr:unnamed protein product [Polarella glacialis]